MMIMRTSDRNMNGNSAWNVEDEERKVILMRNLSNYSHSIESSNNDTEVYLSVKIVWQFNWLINTRRMRAVFVDSYSSWRSRRRRWYNMPIVSLHIICNYTLCNAIWGARAMAK